MIIKVTETVRQGQKERVRQTDGPTDREAQEERGKEASGGGTGDRPNEKDDREREERGKETSGGDRRQTQ